MHKLRVIFLFMIILAGVSLACSTPVFRYAIERWEADPYRLMIFTDGELTTEQQETIRDFKKYERFGFRQPPLMVQEADISTVTNLSATVWAKISTNRSAPAVALLYPSIMRDNSVVWTDDLSTNALNRIVMSPARLETATRLLGGDAAVWLVVQSDSPEENQSVREMLEKKLGEIENSTVYNDDFLQLAKEAGTDVPELRFSVLDVDPNDPREAVFMAMLTRLSPEMVTNSSPVVIPVFGQGRGAVMMMNEFIADEYIERVSEFLTGACSCEVKSLNPGFDILIPVDWVGGITEEYVFDAELPPLTSPLAALEPQPKPEIDSADERIEELEKSETRLFGGVLGLFLIAVLGTLGLVTWLMVRRKPQS